MEGLQTDPSNQDRVQVEDQETINCYDQAASSGHKHLYSSVEKQWKKKRHIKSTKNMDNDKIYNSL